MCTRILLESLDNALIHADIISLNIYCNLLIDHLCNYLLDVHAAFLMLDKTLNQNKFFWILIFLRSEMVWRQEIHQLK